MRRPKPALAAWLIRNRKERGWKPADIASRVDVAEVTVRGWETGRSIRAESVEKLEALFDEQAPGYGGTPEGGDSVAATSALVAALRDQTAAIDRLTHKYDELTTAVLRAIGAGIGERQAILDRIDELAVELGLGDGGTTGDETPHTPRALLPR